jgi:hypothetical protein
MQSGAKVCFMEQEHPSEVRTKTIQNGRSRTVEHFEDHFFWKMLCKSQSPYLNIIKVEPQWSPELWKIIDMTWHDNRNGELKSSSLAIRVSAYKSCGCFIIKRGEILFQGGATLYVLPSSNITTRWEKGAPTNTGTACVTREVTYQQQEDQGDHWRSLYRATDTKSC